MKIELIGRAGDKKLIETNNIIEIEFLSNGFTKVGTIEEDNNYYYSFVQETPRQIFEIVEKKATVKERLRVVK